MNVCLWENGANTCQFPGYKPVKLIDTKRSLKSLDKEIWVLNKRLKGIDMREDLEPISCPLSLELR